MHTDLSPQLHTDQCNELIKLFQQCNLEHPVRKYFGFCQYLSYDMVKCLKQERMDRRAKNFKESQERKKRIAEKLKQLENGS